MNLLPWFLRRSPPPSPEEIRHSEELPAQVRTVAALVRERVRLTQESIRELQGEQRG